MASESRPWFDKNDNKLRAGELGERRRIGRPHGRTERDEVEIDELARVLAVREHLGERGRVVGRLQELVGRVVEADNVAHHSPDRRTHDVAAVGEPTVGRRRPVGHAERRRAWIAVGHGEAHRRVDRLHAQLGEQRHEVRVRAVVVHDETRVDAQHAGRGILDVDRVDVTPQTIVRLEQHDVVLRSEHMSARQPGDPRTDDRDPFSMRCDRSHCRCPRSTPVCSAHHAHSCARRWAVSARRVCGSRWIPRRRRSSQKPPEVRAHTLLAGEPDRRVRSLLR